MQRRHAFGPVFLAAQMSLAAAAQDAVVRFEPTGAPDTYRLSAEFVGELPMGYDASDQLCVWNLAQFELLGDAPITIDRSSVNSAYDTTYVPIEIRDNGTTRVYFKGEMGDPFAPEIIYDFSNPLEVLTFTYAGDPAAFELELTGWNTGFVRTGPDVAGESIVYRYHDNKAGEYTLVSLALGGGCPADTNGDGSLTPADFNAWIMAYNTGSSRATRTATGSVLRRTSTPGS